MTIVNYSIHKASFGKYILATTDKGICDLMPIVGTQDEAVKTLEREVLKRNKYIVFQKIKREDIDLTQKQKLDPQGTPFQKEVWKALLKIKPGQTKTYAEVAKMLGKPSATRAVASAIGANNICMIIPCHRVIRNDGTMGGFRWGVKIKEKMLKGEK